MTHPLAVEGAERALAHADREESEWSQRALDRLRAYMIEAYRPRTFTAETVRAFAECCGLPPPPDPRAWGGVFLGAHKRGEIRFTGHYAPGGDRCHGRPQRVWERV